MEGQSNGTTGYASGDGAKSDFGPAAERLSAAFGSLDRRYGWSQTVKDNPWPAIAVAAGVGFALAESGFDRGAGSATAEATTGVRSSASGLFETLAGSMFDRALRRMTAAFEQRAAALYGINRSSAQSAA